MLQALLDLVERPDMVNLKNLVVLAGLYYSAKFSLKCFKNLWTFNKTFVLPIIWPRNFVNEYGEWAVVTGCSKGIGTCYAYELAKRGMNLVLIARKADLLKKIAEDIKAKHDVKVEVIIADFGQDENLYPSIQEGLHGKDIGILVNNVGVITDMAPFSSLPKDQLWNMIHVNVSSMVMMSRMVLPLMEAKKKGAIINIASIAGLAPCPYISTYSGTKAFVSFFSRSLAKEAEDFGITVQCVYPGPVVTDMLQTIHTDAGDKVGSLLPTPEAYTAQAVRTLGFSNETTGYWSHGLLINLPFFGNPTIGKLANKKQMKVNEKLSKKE